MRRQPAALRQGRASWQALFRQMPVRYSASCSQRTPAFACEGKTYSPAISFESKVPRPLDSECTASYREASVPVGSETYPTHPGRPALTRAGEERLHRQKSNYRESYRRQAFCQAGNLLGGWKLGKNRQIRPCTAKCCLAERYFHSPFALRFAIFPHLTPTTATFAAIAYLHLPIRRMGRMPK